MGHYQTVKLRDSAAIVTQILFFSRTGKTSQMCSANCLRLSSSFFIFVLLPSLFLGLFVSRSFLMDTCELLSVHDTRDENAGWCCQFTAWGRGGDNHGASGCDTRMNVKVCEIAEGKSRR